MAEEFSEETDFPGVFATTDLYNQASTEIIKTVGAAAERAFFALPDYRGAAQRQEYFDLYEQIVSPSRLEMARLTIAYHQEVARRSGQRWQAPLIDFDAIFTTTARAVGETGRFDPYQGRPFKEVYKQLNKGKSLTEAIKVGGARARILAQTDVQLSRRQASLFARASNANIVGYIRTLSGAENCALCYVASTQRYNKNNLSPIHPGCDCGELPIYGDYNVGQVVDQYNLDRIHEAIENRFGVSDVQARDLGIGKAVEYEDGVRLADFTLVSVRDHGELGPVLTQRKESFRTLEQVLARKAERDAILAGAAGEIPAAGLRSTRRQIYQQLERAETYKKVESIMREALGVEFRGFGVGDGSDGIYPLETTKRLAERLVDLNHQYPVPLSGVLGPTQMGAGKSIQGTVFADAGKQTRRIRFYQEFWTDAKQAKEELADAFSIGQLGGQWALDAGIDGMDYITAHEYAHLLDFAAGEKVKPFEIAKKFYLESGALQDGDGIFDRVRREAVVRSLLERDISRYAISNRHELISEAFAQVYFNAPTEVGERIVQAVLRDYQQAVTDNAFEIVKQVTDEEIRELASDAVGEFGDAAIDRASRELLPDGIDAVARVVRASGLVKKKAGLLTNIVSFAAQEIVQQEIVKRVRQEVERQAQAIPVEAE